MIVAGTGHRPDKLGGYSPETATRAEALARRWLREARPQKVISGMALGWDQALAKAALAEGIYLICAIPFTGFGAAWPKDSQYACASMMAVANEVHTVSEIACTAALQQRNKWMVDRADLMLALWDGSWGGTFNCIQYANRKKVPVENLWPRWQTDVTGLLT